jgi:hypothetical protein
MISQTAISKLMRGIKINEWNQASGIRHSWALATLPPNIKYNPEKVKVSSIEYGAGVGVY